VVIVWYAVVCCAVVLQAWCHGVVYLVLLTSYFGVVC
jgi:hypothetical protein